MLWEFLEFATDHLFALDMQKDTILTGFHSVLLDPSHGNLPVPVRGITETVISLADGRRITVRGYLDIGLSDTMKDLFVNFLGAAAFSAIGAVYVRRRGKQPLCRCVYPHRRGGCAGAAARIAGMPISPRRSTPFPVKPYKSHKKGLTLAEIVYNQTLQGILYLYEFAAHDFLRVFPQFSAGMRGDT